MLTNFKALNSDSEDQTNIREMEYATANHKSPTSRLLLGYYIYGKGDFIPQMEKGEIMFYGTQHIYHLMRFYFALYERFLKAYEISQEYEQNSKTALLTDEVSNQPVFRRVTLLGKEKVVFGEIRDIQMGLGSPCPFKYR